MHATAAAGFVAADPGNGTLSCRRDCPAAGEEASEAGCRCQAGWYNATAAGALVRAAGVLSARRFHPCA